MLKSFPGYEIKCSANRETCKPPFRLIFENVAENQNDVDNNDEDAVMKTSLSKSIIVEPYEFESRGPYITNKPKQ